ncbi:MAG TPA: alkaline phosphatase family protein [Candidatus Solibacter sp.]|nr:alkaline phosphatase family protein [Candidatus Solibacter sp.]
MQLEKISPRLGSFAIATFVFSALFCPRVLTAQITEQTQSQPQVTKSPEGKKEEAERAAARAKAHHFDRVVIIVLENVDYERAMQDPNLAALAQRGASFTNFHALFHPSYPNYLAMIAGTDYEIHRRGSFIGDKQVNFPNDAEHRTIADRLVAAGLDFKQYAEEMPPGNCPWSVGGQHNAEKLGNYARRHVPFLSFREVQDKWCDRVIRVDSGKADNYFVQDAKKGLVAYSFYTPNMNHDGHDTTAEVAGAWVRKFLDETFLPAMRKGTLVVVTFDESGGNEDNRIYTLFLGDMVKDASQQSAAALSRRYTHYSVLRTIEDNFGLEPLTENDRAATPITDIWK